MEKYLYPGTNSPMTTTLLRTDAQHKDFIQLVAALDADLAERDGPDHAFYAQFNTLNQNKHVVLYYENDMAVGAGALKHYDQSTVEIKRMYVLPSHRGRGVARIILSALEAWAVELGYVRCILETGMKQVEAMQLYPRAGYTVIPNYGQYTGIDNSVCFGKILA